MCRNRHYAGSTIIILVAVLVEVFLGSATTPNAQYIRSKANGGGVGSSIFIFYSKNKK